MESKKVQITVSESLDNSRLDKFLFEANVIHSRSRAAQLIDKSLVFVNSKSVMKSSFKVSEGDLVEVTIPQLSEEQPIFPLDLDLDIVYDDNDLLVVNKPSGLVVHPAVGHAQDTLVNALVHQVDNLSMGFGENRPGIVHRIDKDTSGLLVIAKNDLSQDRLAKQFKEKTVHRVYKAIVYGHPKENSATLKSFLIRHPVNRKKYCSEKIDDGGSPKGKFSVTHYSVESRLPCGLSLISCQLETGRTHQIRVHMFEQQHGIIGDPIYESAGRLKNLKSARLRTLIKSMNRIALHAEQLGFLHPSTGKKMMFSRPWPEDMNEILKQLKLLPQS